MCTNIGSMINTTIQLQPEVKKADFQSKVEAAVEKGSITQGDFQKLAKDVVGNEKKLSELLGKLDVKIDVSDAFATSNTIPSSSQKAALAQIMGGSSDAESLSTVLKASGIPQKDIDGLMKFASENHIPMSDLLKIASNDNYKTGMEKMGAMQSYSIVYDAANNGRLSPETAKLYKNDVLPALLDGKINIKYDPSIEGKGSRATYVFQNDTFTMPKAIDFNNIEDRSGVLHEMMHLSQDVKELKQNRFSSEEAGHRVEAEYQLYEKGILRNNPDGTVSVNLEKAFNYANSGESLPNALGLEKNILLEMIAKNEKSNPQNNFIPEKLLKDFGVSKKEFISDMTNSLDLGTPFAERYRGEAQLSDSLTGSRNNTDENLNRIMEKDGLKANHNH
jgi:hypothetical protein